MARIRTIKPELARHEPLFQAERETGLPIRFAWALLPTVCDREGRFKWRPRDLKLDILPYDDCDFSHVLDAWLTRGQVVKYRVGREWYGCILTFQKHQSINNKEPNSTLPGIDESEETEDYTNQAHSDPPPTREERVDDASGTRDERESHATSLEGKGREGKGKHANESRVLILHDSLPKAEWDEWMQKRKSKRWPCDALTLGKQLQILAEHDTETQRGMLNNSIQSTWQGVFPPKHVNGKVPADPPRTREFPS